MPGLRVQVVYALPGGEDAVTLELPAGATVADAVAASGIAARHPEVDVTRVGVFSKRVAAGTRVSDGDRVEIYRPLAADPKEARRARAATYKTRPPSAGRARSPSRAGRRR